MAKYKTSEEITKAFRKLGWSDDTVLYSIRLEAQPEILLFIMDNGNIYRDNSEIYWYNIPTILQKSKPEPEIIPPLTKPYYGDPFYFVDEDYSHDGFKAGDEIRMGDRDIYSYYDYVFEVVAVNRADMKVTVRCTEYADTYGKKNETVRTLPIEKPYSEEVFYWDKGYGRPLMVSADDRYSEERYCPSATAGDYSPSCPWNAPGMSIHDFI